jgi:hypothetical protein
VFKRRRLRPKRVSLLVAMPVNLYTPAGFPVPKEHAVCGIIGIVATNAVNVDIYDALTVLQHRARTPLVSRLRTDRGCFSSRGMDS